METHSLAAALYIADQAVKDSPVVIAGVEGSAGTDIVVKFVGDAASVAQVGLVAHEVAARMHVAIVATVRNNYQDPPGAPMVYTKQEWSPINEANLHMLPRESLEQSTPGQARVKGWWTMQALGLLETQGLVAVIEGTDAMLKSANVEVVGKEKIGAAHVTVMIRGDVAAVKAAIETGKAAAEKVGKVVAAHVIARPHEGLAKLLPG